MVDSAQVIHPVIEAANSGLGILILGSVFGIAGFFLKGLLKSIQDKLNSSEDRIKSLELATVDLSTVKTSLANFSQRLGSAEARDAVQDQMFKQLSDTLVEIKENEKQNGQVFTEIFSSLNTIKTDLSIIKFRLDSEDKGQS